MGIAWAAGTVGCRLISTVMEMMDVPTEQPAESLAVVATWTPEVVVVLTHTPMRLAFPTGTVDATATPEVVTPSPTYTVSVTPTAAPSSVKAQGQKSVVIHAVSAGETLSGIAAAYGVSLDDLVRENQIDDPSFIRVGQKLVIPGMSAASQPTRILSVPPGPTAIPEPSVPLSGLIPGIAPPTRLVISKIGVDAPVEEVSWHVNMENGKKVKVWDVADYAASWHQGSAVPGSPGNTVISGHNNIKGEVFRYLVELEQGDAVDLYVGNQRYPYVVTEKYLFPEKGLSYEERNSNARWISRTVDERVTLVSCWPYTNNTHRLVVVAKPAQQ